MMAADFALVAADIPASKLFPTAFFLGAAEAGEDGSRERASDQANGLAARDTCSECAGDII
jgi:hypothetical protein